MRFSIQIETENDGLVGDNTIPGIQHILNKIKQQLSEGRDQGRIADYNGNHVGDWWLESEDHD